MKKLVYFMLLLLAILVIPMTVYAEGEEGDGEAEVVADAAPVSNKVKIYFFRGEGCPHCQEAEEWFASLDEETKAKFDIVDYETWNSQENAELMQKVAEARGESDQATGVPYIIVGDMSWVGFASEMSEEILSQINTVYEQEVSERYDVMDLVETGSTVQPEEKKSNDVVPLLIVLVIVFGIGFGVYKARQNVSTAK